MTPVMTRRPRALKRVASPTISRRESTISITPVWREGGWIVSVVAVIAVAVKTDGQREIRHGAEGGEVTGIELATRSPPRAAFGLAGAPGQSEWITAIAAVVMS